MAAYSSVFKRVEKKYRIGAAERAAVEAAAGGPMAVDAYGALALRACTWTPRSAP